MVNSLGPSDAIWRWRSWSTLVQVMACCLMAPSHYLNQCWLIISKVLWHSSEDIIIRSPRGQWVDILIRLVLTTWKHIHTCPHFNIKAVFPGMGIPIVKISWSWDHLIFIMGIPIPIRWHDQIVIEKIWKHFLQNLWTCVKFLLKLIIIFWSRTEIYTILWCLKYGSRNCR